MLQKASLKLTVLSSCLIVATVNLVKAYTSRSLSEAIAVVVIWLVVGPLVGLWWLRLVERQPQQRKLRIKLYSALVSTLLFFVVITYVALRTHRTWDALAAFAVCLVLFPCLAVWVFLRQRTESHP
jgi:uncharacterized membrane protein YpjA